ncbi:MAG: DNA-binding response regulator, partial [Candidatus Electrothrix sp. ATG2]|nr:DNA-binding response regulator [Candidatus Electrothrix sp. ATG2]
MKRLKKYVKTPADVLIIDDDESLLLTTKLVIENEGHNPRTATNGIDCQRLVQEKKPDIIILDLMMPGLDGYEVCQRLKGNPSTENIPVIFLSSHDTPEEKVKAFEAGGVDYLVKPYSRIELLIRLSTHLTLQHIQNTLSSEVKKRTEELEEKNEKLHETNLVLKRLLHEIEEEKLEMTRIMQTNIKRLVLPELARIAEAPAQLRYQLRDTIQSNLLDLSSPVAGKNFDIYSLLTPTELRVVNLIRQGRSSKEIAETLNLSPQTVATHRKHIRKKLNLSGKKINL